MYGENSKWIWSDKQKIPDFMKLRNVDKQKNFFPMQKQEEFYLIQHAGVALHMGRE